MKRFAWLKPGFSLIAVLFLTAKGPCTHAADPSPTTTIPPTSTTAAVMNMVRLKTLATTGLPAGTVVPLAGYYSTGDGGGGFFTWSPSSVATDNGGTVIAPTPTPSSGRWLRAPATRYDVKWFGARGDAATDDSAAINAAIDAATAAGGRTVWFPQANYRVPGSPAHRVVLKSNLVLEFEAGCIMSTGIPSSPVTPLVIDTAYSSFLRNIVIHGNGLQIVGDRTTNNTCYGFSLNVQNAGDVLCDVVISDILVTNCRTDGFTMGGNAGLVPENITVERVICDHNYRNGASLQQGKHVTFRDCWFKNTTGTAPQAGFDLEPNPGLEVSDVTFSNCRFSGNAGNGLYVQGTSTSRVNVADCWFESNTGAGLDIIGATNFRVENCLSRDNAGHGYFLSSTAGFGTVVGCIANQNGGHGFTSVGCEILAYSGCIARANRSAGINFDKNPSGTVNVSSSSFVANTTKGIIFNGCSNVSVTGCTVILNHETGVAFEHAVNNGLVNSFIAENGQAGDRSDDNVIVESSSHDNNISDNLVRQSRNFHPGIARAGSSTTITLATTAQDSTDDFYQGMTVRILSGLGRGQSRKITRYVAGTRVATVDSPWSTPPDNTSRVELSSACRPRYGIYVTSGCVANKITNNDLLYAGSSGAFVDRGTDTLTTTSNRVN